MLALCDRASIFAILATGELDAPATAGRPAAEGRYGIAHSHF
jgi:hypothetical protein